MKEEDGCCGWEVLEEKWNEHIKQLIKEINSNYARAAIAHTTGDAPNELKHSLYAVGDIAVLLLRRLDDGINEETAKTYAESLKNTSAKIKRMIDDGVK